MGLFFLICRKFSTYWNNLCILKEGCITAEGNMKVLRGIFVLIAFVSAVFFACTNEKNDPVCTDDDCDEVSSSGNNSGNSSSSGQQSTVGTSSSSSAIQAGTYPTLVEGQSGVSKGWASRYWDGCKPSCSWSDKQQAPLGGTTRCKTCSSNGTSEIAANDNNKSACDGGNSYTCFDQVPIIVNENLAYAFAATPGNGNQCGKCYQIQFDGGFQHGNPPGKTFPPHNAIRGKTLIVMSSNIGGDVHDGQFDVMIPGGGVGLYDSFSSQIGVSKSQLGQQYGGLLADCVNDLDSRNNWNGAALAEYQTCLRNKCNSVFGSKNANLLNGCLFYANWAMAANNPTLLYKEVQCPQELITKYKATMF
jgi:hypothetical protein